MIEVTLGAQRAIFIPHDGMAKRGALPPCLCRIGHIQAFVAAACNISPVLMRSPARDRFAAWPRQVAMYLAREITGKSFPCIGREFGRRDHTTVIYAIKAVEKRMAADPFYRAGVEALRERLAA